MTSGGSRTDSASLLRLGSRGPPASHVHALIILAPAALGALGAADELRLRKRVDDCAGSRWKVRRSV